MRLPFKIYSDKKYWLWKARLEKLLFLVRRQQYKTKIFLRSEQTKSKSTIAHIKISFWSVIKAITFIIILFLIEKVSYSIWQSNLSAVPQWLINLQKIVPKPTYPDDRDAVIELVSVIASVTGVILALFYPILATIASTAYAKVHASIRNLLLYEKETQGYLRRLTYLTASAITVLLFVSFNQLPGTVVLGTLAFYCLTTIFGILKIGLGVYNFFEPSTLARIVLKNLGDTIKNVTTEGEFWYDGNFQNHNYKRAFEQTENLSLIISLCLKDDDLKESSFKSSINSSLLVLRYYLTQKPKIPIDSLWFPNINSHLSYFESDMTARGLSRSTNTFIRPKTKQDFYWFEERIISNISYGLESIVKSGHINLLGEIISMSYSLIESLGAAADFKTGSLLLNKITQNVLHISDKKEKKIELTDYDSWQHELACIETYCYAILRFQAAILDRAAQFNSAKINTEFKKINWDRKETIYLTDFTRESYEHLNKFSQYVKNEKVIEGKQITPDWYFQQWLTSEYLIVMTDKISETIKLFDKHLLNAGNHFSDVNNPLLSSFTAQIGLEVILKLKYRLAQLEPILEDIDKIEIIKGEFKWKKPDLTELVEELNLYETTCFSLIAGNIEKMSFVKWDSQYPDVFAQSYSILSTKIDSCYGNDDIVGFENYFARFLKSALDAFGNLNKIFKHYNKPENISYQTLLDAMEISGLAYIYSVVYKKPEYWSIVTKGWEKNFLPSKENIRLLVVFYSYYKNTLHGTGINFNEKHQRGITLRNVIKKLGVRSKNIEDFPARLFVTDSHYSSFYEVAELFIELYLFTFIEAKEATAKLKRNLFEQWVRHVENPKTRFYEQDDD